MKNKLENNVAVIEKDSIDRMLFSDLLEISPNLQNLAEGEKAQAEVLSDAFSSLYKIEPKVLEGVGGPARQAINQMLEMPEYQALREYTKLDEVCSGVGTIQLGQGLIEAYKKALEFEKEKQEEGEDGEPGEDGLTEGQAREMRLALRQALNQAKEEAKDTNATLKAWGLTSEDLKQIPYQARMDLVETLRNPNMKKITQYLGRLRHALRGMESTKFTHGLDELVDIRPGNDLTQLLPQELLKLVTQPEVFMADFAEGRLMQYNMKGIEPKDKGPFIMCLDCSYSMFEQDREAWSKAVAFVLAELAAKQKRDCAIIPFNTRADIIHYLEKGKNTFVKRLEAIGYQVEGGTDFKAPLNQTLKVLEKSQFKNGDLVFITDGEMEMSQSQVEKFKEKFKDIRILGVFVGTGVSESLVEIGARALAVSNILDSDEARALDKQILKLV